MSLPSQPTGSSSEPAASLTPPTPGTMLDVVFPADTETGRMCREFDWASTPLGAVESWPEGLRSIVALVMRQGMPQSACVGPDLRQIYNDAYRLVMGDKHPAGLGQPVLENWREVAADVDPLFARVLAGETIYFEELPLRVHRNGSLQDAAFTFSYSPMLSASGEIIGALINCVEVTDQLFGRRAQLERDELVRALEFERSRLAAVFEQSPSFLAVLRGPDDVFEMVNPAYQRFIGEGRDVVGMALFDALPETRGQGFEATHRHVRETGEQVVIRELRVMIARRPGEPPEERFMDVTYLPIVEGDGSRSAIIAHGADITDSVRARVALEVSNQQLQDNAVELELQTEELQMTAAHLEERTEEAEHARRTVSAIVEAVTDGFVAFDGDLRFTYVNRQAAEMWHTTPDTLIGKSPSDVFSWMDRSPFLAMAARVSASGHPEVLEEYATSLRATIEARAYPLAGGGVVMFFSDVGERRRAEASARFLVEASQLLGAAAEYQTLLANLAAAAVPRLGDWCAVDVLAEPDSTAWPPKVERVAAMHQDAAKRELVQSITTAFPLDWSSREGTSGVMRSGKPLFIAEVSDAMLAAGARSDAHLAMLRALDIRSLMIVPLVARDRVLGAITLVMAESERRFTDADLTLAIDLGRRAGVALDNARLLRDANAANAAKTEFLRTVSHELRQPLNAIRGYVDLWKLGLRGEMPAAMRADIERLSLNQEHLTTLIEDLLSFTRLEAGQLPVDVTSVPLADVVGTLDAMLRPEMLARGIEFSSAVDETGLAVMADRIRLVQICANLLTNAVRATSAGGHIALECTARGDVVTVAVTDTGVGIAEDLLEHIFSPFTQLGRALNAPREGAGLGLAISRGLAHAMGGSLTAASVVGAGSTFTLVLPRAR